LGRGTRKCDEDGLRGTASPCRQAGRRAALHRNIAAVPAIARTPDVRRAAPDGAAL